MAKIIRYLIAAIVVIAIVYVAWPKPVEENSPAPVVAQPPAVSPVAQPSKAPAIVVPTQGKREISSGDADVTAARTGALNRLDKSSDKSWTPVFDLSTRRLKTLKDGVLNISKSTPEEKSVEFLKQYSQDLFGVSPENLPFDRTIVTDRAKAVFGQRMDGLRVYGGTVALVYEEGQLMRIQNDLFTLKPEPPSAVMSLNEAEKRVQTYGAQIVKGPSKQVTLVVSDPSIKTELIYYPAHDRLVKAYQIVVDVWKDDTRSERMLVVMNAHDGSLILSRNLRVK